MMKQTFQLIVVVFLLLGSSCKKEAIPAEKDLLGSSAQPAIEAPLTSTGEWSVPNKLVGFNSELNAAFEARQPILVRKVSETQYLAEAIATPQTTAAGGTGCNRVMDRLESYLVANKIQFEAWANAHCQPYKGIYHDPCGKKIVFVVLPSDTNCGVAIENWGCGTWLNYDGWMVIEYSHCIND